MKLLIVPGKIASQNSGWLLSAASQLKMEGVSVDTLEYAHWNNPGQEIDIQNESDKINRYDSANSNYIIVAKSIGVILTLIANQNERINPKAAIFLGAPVKEKQSDDFLELFASAKFPVLFIQQEKDKLTTFENLKIILQKANISNISMKSIPGDDHLYDNFEQILTIISEWLSGL